MIEYPSSSWKEYELLDSGNGLKLERFGNYILSRPEPKALWSPSMSEQEWKKLAHTCFIPGAGFGKAGKEDSGIWERHRRMDDQWYIRYTGDGDAAKRGDGDAAQTGARRDGDGALDGQGKVQGNPTFDLRLGLTSFKHVGVFPEQAPNWEFIFRHARSGSRVLNLFAYTGAASLAARAAGADVTHLDAVRQVVTWARGNMEHSGLDGIHWVVEDAMKFASREARRGHLYDGIILDPPAYGHGPDGERWKLDECLFGMLKTVGSILAPDGWVVLNLYSNGFSAALGETVARQAIPGIRKMESGELALNDRFGKVLPLSIVVRIER